MGRVYYRRQVTGKVQNSDEWVRPEKVSPKVRLPRSFMEDWVWRTVPAASAQMAGLVRPLLANVC
jgi:hypothetical protein